jgi:hypothetical protein
MFNNDIKIPMNVIRILIPILDIAEIILLIQSVETYHWPNSNSREKTCPRLSVQEARRLEQVELNRVFQDLPHVSVGVSESDAVDLEEWEGCESTTQISNGDLGESILVVLVCHCEKVTANRYRWDDGFEDQIPYLPDMVLA